MLRFRLICRRAVARLLVPTLLLGALPAAWGAETGPQGRLEGIVVDASGGPASGVSVLLVDDAGDTAGAAAVGRDGLYTFPALAAGRYSMALANAGGAVAPVAAEPVRIRAGTLVRRDLTLLPADVRQVQSAARNYGLGIWWVSRTQAERIWTVVGVVGGLGILWALVRSSDETTASPSTP